MIIKTCIFKRDEYSYWETGITTESNECLIIDKSGRVVESVYDIRDKELYLLIDVTPILEYIDAQFNR